ncbi:MAG: copper chaperone PCu(A)C [Pseudomonadota bacterium]
MTKILQLVFTAFLVLGVTTVTGLTHEYSTGHLVIEHPHMTTPIPGAKVSAGYVAIRNTGTERERLVAVKAEFADKTQIHNMEIVDGIAKMRPVRNGLIIPAGGQVTLKRGGLHLMFIKVSNSVDVGQLLPVKFLFEKAGIVEVEMIVIDPEDLDDEESDSEMDHSSHAN